MNGRLLARRAGIVTLCAVSLLACVGLAWWQWQRFESASGTFQNLGYVLQWPLFGLFPAFMFWRLRKLRAQQHEPASPIPPILTPTPEPVPEPAPVAAADEDDDPELAAYNRYLAKLDAMHQEKQL